MSSRTAAAIARRSTEPSPLTTSGTTKACSERQGDFEHASISKKLKALLVIAGKTAVSGKNVTAADVARARDLGATDLEIHDTVLIAAVFCMCNRYVDGLATWAPHDPGFYRERAALVAEHGYALSAVTPSPTTPSHG